MAELAARQHDEVVSLSERVALVVLALWGAQDTESGFIAAAVEVVSAANIAAVRMVDRYALGALTLTAGEPVDLLAADPERYVSRDVIETRLRDAVADIEPDVQVHLRAGEEPRQASQARLSHHIRDSQQRWVQVGGACSLCAPHRGQPIDPSTLPRHRSCSCTAAPI